MSKTNQPTEKRWEMYLRFETERVAALAKLLNTPTLSSSEAALQQKLLQSLPKSLHPILCQYGSLTAAEKQYYYRKGFIDCKKFTQSCAAEYPARLPAILGVTSCRL